MEKTFQSFEQLLSFNFDELEPQKSNYLKLISPTLPKVRKEFEVRKWRIAEKHNASSPGILFEITPRWLTITIHRTTGSLIRQKEFNILRKDAKTIIKQIFEPLEGEKNKGQVEIFSLDLFLFFNENIGLKLRFLYKELDLTI